MNTKFSLKQKLMNMIICQGILFECYAINKLLQNKQKQNEITPIIKRLVVE